MLLTSPVYFVFLAAVFFAYWLAARWRATGLAVLLFANYFFYAKWDLVYLFLIPAASSCDFLIALALGRANKPWLRGTLVTVSLGLNLGLLASVKYLPGRWNWVLP